MSDEIAIISTEQMKSLIYEIRGQKVMLDKDLSKIYGYETKNFNRQVKNNIEKFPDDFMFQLTYDEALRCNFFTLNKNGNMRGQHIKYLPYAFTEQGIYMLMTVLKGELATQQSLALIRIFKSMKDYVSSGSLVSAEDFLKLSIQTNENRSAIARLETEVLKKSDLPMIFKAFSDENANEYLFMNGELCEAAATYQKIYSKAKKSIYIIDDYISLHTLLLFRHIGAGIDIVIYSDNKSEKTDIEPPVSLYFASIPFQDSQNFTIFRETWQFFHPTLHIVFYFLPKILQNTLSSREKAGGKFRRLWSVSLCLIFFDSKHSQCLTR